MSGNVISSIRRKSWPKRIEKKVTEIEAFMEVWEEEKREREKGIDDLKSGVQSQKVFMLHPLWLK